MRRTFYAVATLLILLLAAGCRGQVTMLTATPLPTSTPDTPATEAYTAYIAGQTAVADAQTDNAATASALETIQAEFTATREASAALELTARIALNTEREALSIAQTEVARDTDVLQQSVEAIASEQAILTADRAALDSERGALATERGALEATRTAEAETRAALAVEATATAIAQAAQQTALASEQTALAEAQNALATARVALDDERAAIDSERAALENERTILEGERAALEGEMSAVATAQAALQTDSAPPVIVTLPPTPVSDQAGTSETLWQQVDLPEFGITLMIPPGFEHRSLGSTEITYQRDDDPIWPSTIQIQQATLDDLFGGEAPANLDTGDPAAVLAAGLEDVTEDDFMTLLSPAESFPGLAFPAAQARTSLLDTENPVVFVLLHTGEDSWLLMVITAPEADLAEWLDPIGHSIVPLGNLPPVSAPTRIPVLTPTPVPAVTQATSLDEAIQTMGIAFAPPAGWTFEVLEASEFAYPNIELTDPADADYFIGLIRFTTEEFSTGVAEILAGQSAVDTLTAIAAAIPNDLGVEVTSPRVNEVTLGALTGAWTQLQDEAEVNRLYLFTLGEDEWLLVGAFGPREGFNAFSRAALHDFLASLRPAAG